MSNLIRLQQKGVIVLKNIFPLVQLEKIIQVTEKCFSHLESLIREKGIENVSKYLPPHYNFLPHVTALNIIALKDYDPEIIEEIFQLINRGEIQEILEGNLTKNYQIELSQCWLRKQYAPANYHQLHHGHIWHQDGALGLNFPLVNNHQYVDLPLNNLITLWLPLNDCGVKSPGLQFISKPLTKPLYFTYLREEILRKMFKGEDFYNPELALGDLVIFLAGTLHQTFINSTMIKDRISIEIRCFQC